MTTMYTALIYPQSSQDTPYGRPAIPSTFVSLAFTSNTWNPYSVNDSDRTEYWIDTAGTLTFEDAMGAAYGIPGLQAYQIDVVNTACGVAIETGFPAIINGIATVITLGSKDQPNTLMAATSSQFALANAVAWAANTTYPAKTLINVGGVIYVTFLGGISGATAPTWNNAFQTATVDNTITWYKLGFWVGTNSGNQMVDPQTVISLFQEGVEFVSTQRGQYQLLKSQIFAATTPAAILACTW